jgi:hypothetical protein|tara:strand:- start:10781 stop:11407 length:627 start_codon:yes stop_codon:yes gene_type:complete
MIIGLCGLIGSGKGTVADILVDEHNFEKISFADKLKDAVSVLFDWDRAMLEGETSESRVWREQEDSFWTKETGRKITPRLVLQEFGTDCMRNGFFDGVWVSFVRKKIIENPEQNFCIPDVRFTNEAEIIKGMGGKIWCVKRGPDPLWFRQYVDLDIEPTDVHPSEWRWAKVSFDHNIYNEGTIDDLKSQVQGRLASTLRLASAEVVGN